MMACGMCNNSSGEDELVKLLVFGVTGQVGRAVAQACSISPWMKVHGFSRQQSTKPNPTDSENKETQIKNVTVIKGNMLEYESVLAATKNMDVIFLSTFFWETMNPKIEYNQGYNVINAAVENGVKHVIYSCSDYIPEATEKEDECAFFEAKARIANYLIYIGLPYTIVRMGWFYENFLGVFRPHPVSEKSFAVALPMEGVALNMGSLKDFSKCIHNIAIRPHVYINRTFSLAACHLTVKEIAQSLETNLPEFTFFDPGITLRQFKKFEFQGARELATMFRHYQSQLIWDLKILHEFCYSVSMFDDWVANSKQEILYVLEEQLLENLAAIGEMKSKGHSLAIVTDGVVKRAQEKIGAVSDFMDPSKVLHLLGVKKSTRV